MKKISEFPPTAPSSMAVHGGWGAWSPWSRCSSNCGLGVRTRTRVCNNPHPAQGGAPCPGCDTQTEVCEGDSIRSLECIKGERKHSNWTPWLVEFDDLGAVSANQSKATFNKLAQRRYRVECIATSRPARATNKNPLQVIADLHYEQRICEGGKCLKTRNFQHTRNGMDATKTEGNVWDNYDSYQLDEPWKVDTNALGVYKDEGNDGKPDKNGVYGRRELAFLGPDCNGGKFYHAVNISISSISFYLQKCIPMFIH